MDLSLPHGWLAVDRASSSKTQCVSCLLCVLQLKCHIFSSRSLVLGVTRRNDRACIVFETSGTSVTNIPFRSIPHLAVGCFLVDPLILGAALSILISSFPLTL